MKGLLDVGSRIIQKSDIGFSFTSGFSRSRNKNKVVLDKFLSEVDYRDKSKLVLSCFIEDSFYDYLSSTLGDKDGIIITDGNNEHLVTYYNKFNSRYTGKVSRRMSYLCYKYKNTDCVFVTLTVDPKHYDSFVDSWIDIKKQFNRFLSNVRIYLKDHRSKLPDYISSVEVQHGGLSTDSWLMPHIHVVFLGVRRLMDWRKLRDFWKLGFIWINRTYDKKKIRKPIDYITKYITKTYSETDGCNVLDQAVQWFFNMRSFSYSNGLLYPLSYTMGKYECLFRVNCDSKYIFNWINDNMSSLMDSVFNVDYSGYG